MKYNSHEFIKSELYGLKSTNVRRTEEELKPKKNMKTINDGRSDYLYLPNASNKKKVLYCS